MSQVYVEMETGSTSLPEDIQALRFRVEEIHLHTMRDGWIALPADLNNVEIVPNRSFSRQLLSTHVLPASYDSLGVRIGDVFVLYGENAGGPLAWPKRRVVKSSLNVDPKVGATTQIRLVFEPGASLSQDDNCRWYFVPFWSSEVRE